ncbi:uncharacterized protein LOC131071222 isoform X2 [Cryptomeria japonica]|uniref:uncharacterized protein LOC131071222 isoform X2 n=1 Tax=Cryptomeria japonica TaxID=3369 RepID=UPI0027DA3080|nr:uncharacterized protein LOC131071222 isoform X2 [Cryptomeria japonica]
MGRMKFVVGLAITLLFAVAEGVEFDVRQHLGTSTRYETGKAAITGANPNTPPIGCTPVHLNLVARHGTRTPTEKRAKELKKLEKILNSAGHTIEEDAYESKQGLPSWLMGWRSPWESRKTNGELTREGEEELYHLGKRVRERFPKLFNEDYHPAVYSIISTQVPRASASAVAFGMGLFAGKGGLGPGRQRAFAVTSNSLEKDTLLRFHDACETYKVELLEWADDVEMHYFKGYGNLLNYQMGVRLLEDVFNLTEQAKIASTGCNSQGFVQKAQLRFAHAETIIPFTCLLGLFVEASDIDKFQSNKPLKPPVKAPQQRRWRGSTVAPFAANNMLVLYKCPAKDDNLEKVNPPGDHDRFFVQILHNEKPASLPNCNGSSFCPFEVFKANVVGPHLQQKFELLCNTPTDCPLANDRSREDKTNLKLSVKGGHDLDITLLVQGKVADLHLNHKSDSVCTIKATLEN